MVLPRYKNKFYNYDFVVMILITKLLKSISLLLVRNYIVGRHFGVMFIIFKSPVLCSLLSLLDPVLENFIMIKNSYLMFIASGKNKEMICQTNIKSKKVLNFDFKSNNNILYIAVSMMNYKVGHHIRKRG